MTWDNYVCMVPRNRLKKVQEYKKKKKPMDMRDTELQLMKRGIS